MASASEPGEKICALCQRDCSKRPRTKDDDGRYYCRECVERLKQARRQPAQNAGAPAAPPVSASVEALLDDTSIDLLAEVVEETASAPALTAAPPVSPNVTRGQRVTAPPTAVPSYEDREFNFKIPEFVKRPWFTFLVPAVVLGLLFDHARTNPSSASLFLGPLFLFVSAVWIIILVEAFRDGIVTGLLTLFLPFYVLYYVLSVNESPHIKALFAVSLIFMMAGFLLIPDLASMVAGPPGASR